MTTLRNTTIRMAAIWLSAAAAMGACCSCAKEAEERPAVPAVGRVDVSFSLKSMLDGAGTKSSNGAATTKATEAGDNDLNENVITRLDLYVFKSSDDDAAFTNHVYCTYDGSTTSGYGTLTYSTTPDATSGKCTGTWTETGLYYENDALEGKALYLVANWDDAPASFSTLADLKAATIGGDTFAPTLQESFVMDGKAAALSATDGGNVTTTTEDGSTTYTVSVELSRALSKIRIQVLDKDGKDITDSDEVKVEYTLNGYAYVAGVVADGTYLSATGTLKKAGFSSSSVPWQTVGKAKRAVFYSYPNDWFDSTKDIREEEPIINDRQTYVMLHAPYTGDDGVENEYWYKVPVNYRLQEDNDAVNPVVDKSLYQLQRNHLYDITVLIDQPGGSMTNPVTIYDVRYQAQEWDDKGGSVTFE